MTKEKLINELENYKTLYKVEKKREQLEKYNEMLSNQNQTYETTFNILKGSASND